MRGRTPRPTIGRMQIAIFLYDHMTALDAVGPLRGAQPTPRRRDGLRRRAARPGACDTGSLALVADAALADHRSPDVVVVPGWSGARQTDLLQPGPVQDWLRDVDQHTTWTTSACTGSLILAAAGLLHGRRATTHWLAHDHLARLGAAPPTSGSCPTASTSPPPASPPASTWPSPSPPHPGDQTRPGHPALIEYDPQPPFDGAQPPRPPPTSSPP